MHLLPTLLLAATEGEVAGTADLGIYPLLISLIPLLPILGFAFTALFGRRLQFRFGRNAAAFVPVSLIILVWLIALAVIVPALDHAAPFGEEGLTFTLWTWIPAGDFTVDLGFHVDALTAVLLLVVTTIGMLVHVYSIGYMAHDPAPWRFFAYLNLFMFSMLVLVLASSWVLVFAGWELVGLSSYSLIGFWYHKRSAALAAKKAFIVNRVGDVGFALGIMAIWVNTGTMDIHESLERLIAPDASLIIPIGIVALLVFAGAMGKSAQFPLHVWLPDAMEGPTPVSALIHAATMVNAGVYLVARANPLFAHAQETMVVVAAIGIFTAIFAASIAFTQTDIKRVLAYSTLSQLGYMFAALGIGAYVAAIFHLMTHGFFKGLLFLGSGSVIHAVHEEQDMNRMGGLWRKIPITHWTMLIGTIAIAGIPPLAGFFSKDEILGEAFKFEDYWVWFIGLVVAGMTAFYMWRLMGKTFYGESHVDPHVEPRIHESPWQMTVPLILLAIPSIFIGYMTAGPMLFGTDMSGHHKQLPFFLGAIEVDKARDVLGLMAAEHWHGPVAFALHGFLAPAFWLAFGGFALATFLYLFKPHLPGRIAHALRWPVRVLERKYFMDDLWIDGFAGGGLILGQASRAIDAKVIDGAAVNGSARLVGLVSSMVRRVQSGYLYHYAFAMIVGLIALLAVIYKLWI